MHLGATRMMPQVPATQAKLKIQRRILKKIWSLICLVVLLWDCVLVRLYNCVTGERFLNCLWFSPVQHHRHVLPVVSNLTINLHRRLANFDDKCNDGDADGDTDMMAMMVMVKTMVTMMVNTMTLTLLYLS